MCGLVASELTIPRTLGGPRQIARDRLTLVREQADIVIWGTRVQSVNARIKLIVSAMSRGFVRAGLC
jgi:hypothetical protein